MPERTALIVGASRGLGLAFVKHLASIEGNTVIGLVRNKSATEEQLAKDGFKNINVVSADITSGSPRDPGPATARRQRSSSASWKGSRMPDADARSSGSTSP